MKTPPPKPLTLTLKPVGRGQRLQLSLRGTVLNEGTTENRQRLLAVLEAWAQPATLDVVFSADELDDWAWSQPWTDALDTVAGVFSVCFAVRGGRRETR